MSQITALNSKVNHSFEIEIPHVGEKLQTTFKKNILLFFNDIEASLDRAIPNFTFQNQLDTVGSMLEKQFDCLPEFNQWLDTEDKGQWYRQLALFLVKLPMRSIRNIIKLLYNVIKSLLYTVIHPLKALTQAVKQLVLLIEELSKPKNWSRMGAGIFGASFGQLLGTCNANPLSTIGIGVGVAMMIAGISIDSLKTAIEAEKGQKLQAVTDCLFSHAKQIPEAMLTGFFMGLLMGAVQRQIQAYEQSALHVTNQASATQWAKQYASAHNLPPPDHVTYVSPHQVTLSWNNPIHNWLQSPMQYRNFVNLDPTQYYQIDIFRNQFITNYGSIGIGATAAYKN